MAAIAIAWIGAVVEKPRKETLYKANHLAYAFLKLFL
jgi:hypothetical protein